MAEITIKDRSKKTGGSIRVRNYEVNDQPSETIPGESFTTVELLQRWTQGNLPEVRRQIYHDNPESFDDIDVTKDPAFDLADAFEYREKAKQKELLNQAYAEKTKIAEAEIKAKTEKEKSESEAETKKPEVESEKKLQQST